MAREDDMMSMQEEAVRRVREMQRRSQSYVGQSAGDNSAQTPTAEEAVQPKTDGAGAGVGVGQLFDLSGLKIDEEKALIGMLIYVLYKNGADMKLILALGYLLL